MTCRAQWIWLILAVLFLVVSVHWAMQPEPKVEQASVSENLYLWYSSYNDVYFGDKLARDPVISHEKIAADEYAHTVYSVAEQRYHIVFNTKYPLGPRFEHLILQHEMCHIETYDENVDEPEAVKDHGPLWRACQLRLELNGAWRNELIDGYRGN